MATERQSIGNLPVPSQWGIQGAVGRSPVVRGTFIINSVTDNTVTGSVNFRGTPVPMSGYWDPNTEQIRLDSPYATFTGKLSIFDDPSISIRHFILSGRLIMKAPSLQAGETGDWIATTDTALTGPPVKSNGLPPVGAFLTSDILYYNYQNRMG